MAAALALHQARSSAPGTRLRVLVLASGPGRCTGIDVASGAFVRGRWASAADPEAPPYRLADAVIAADEAPPDPACPEDVLLERPPQPAGRLPRRRTEHYLRALEAPPGLPLLGFRGPAIPYWQVPGTHPSLALLRPTRGPQLAIASGQPDDAGHGPALPAARARFQWGGLEHSLPVADPRLVTLALATGRHRLSGDALARAVGYRPRYILVALTGPEGGHCYKSVATFLPPP